MIITDMYINKRKFNHSLTNRDLETQVSTIQGILNRTIHIDLGVMRQPLGAYYISELGFTTTN